jgi:hypothetical protein
MINQTNGRHYDHSHLQHSNGMFHHDPPPPRRLSALIKQAAIQKVFPVCELNM